MPRRLGLPLVLTALLLLQGCLCNDDIVRKVTSPDGLLVATHYVRKCGAAAEYSTRVNLRSSREQFYGDEGLLFSAKGEAQITVEWNGSKHLRISCEKCTREEITRQVVKVADVDIDFDLPGVAAVPMPVGTK